MGNGATPNLTSRSQGSATSISCTLAPLVVTTPALGEPVDDRVWRPLRQKFRLLHSDPVNRSQERELTFLNTSDGEQSLLVLDFGQYRPGLRVQDNAGRELGYLPHDVIRDELGHNEGVLAVFLETPVAANHVAVIRLIFEDMDVSREEEDPTETRWERFRRRLDLIREPTYYLEDPYVEAAKMTRIYEIRGPPEAVVQPVEFVGLPAEEAVEIGLIDSSQWVARPQFFFARVPSSDTSEIEVQYRIEPLPSERRLLRMVYWGLLAIPIVLLTLVLLPEFSWPVAIWRFATPTASLNQNTAILGITATLAIIALLRPVWVNRWAFCVPLTANVLLLFSSR